MNINNSQSDTLKPYLNLTYLMLWSPGRPLERNITPDYGDETYLPSGGHRPNARLLSNQLFSVSAAGVPGLGTQRNLTAVFAFFGRNITYFFYLLNHMT